MGQWVGAQGRPKCGQNFQNMPSLWHHLQKTPPKTKRVFFSISSRRLAESVDGLDSSLAQLGGKLQHCKLAPKFWRARDLKGFNPLTTVFGRPFFGHKSPAARARELFKPFTDSASLLVDIEKKRFSFSVGVFWRWCHNEGMFWKF